MRKGLLASGVALASLVFSAQTAYAQAAAEAGADEQGIGDIVVTAQRREESLQKVPIAVSAVTADALAKTGLVTVESLSGQVPNLNVSQNIGQARVTIRGIGIDSISLGSEGSVAFYQDGVFFTRSNAAMASFYDVDRVEVLRGPQGTLYGRNATGGSINIFTKAPTDHLDGYLSATVGNYGTINSEGAISGPLSEGLQGRISFQTRYNNGFGENIATGHRIDNEDSQAIRAQLKYNAGDLTMLLSGDYYRKDDASNGGHYFGRGQQLVRNGPFVQPLGEALGGVVATNVRDLSNGRDPYVKAEFYGGRLDINYDVNDSVSLRSLSAYRHTDFKSLTDIVGSSFDLFPLYNWEIDDQFSQEFQINYNSDTHKLVLGAYYLNDKVNGGSRGEYNVGTMTAPFFLQGYFAGGTQKTNTVAVFGQDTINVSDRLRVTLGARYSWEKKEINNVSEFNFVDVFSPSYVVQTPYRAASKSWSSFTPKIGIDFDVADRVMVYASYSKGFKSGLFDLQGDRAPAVNPEKVDAFDAGIKVTTGSVRANFAGFYYKYKDMQVGKVTGAALLLENAATATIYGLESELTVKPIPAPLTLSVSASWLHARFDDYVSVDPARLFGDGVTSDSSGAPAFNLKGNHLAQSPDYTVNASAEYVIEAPFGDFTLRAESLWQGRTYFDSFNTPQNLQKAYNLQNASITFNSDDKNWMISAFVRNIANKTIKGSAHVGFVPIGAPVLGYLLPPRTIGVTVRRNF
ncbi:TonB-dependent receptor [Novosphingobium mathurense]|uniref:Iron complex outermembrane recepter protein n=1 Tax=Novosphingobium mathurense TaxID=428990 RepID=A0A1U6IJB8_9SPHN|nr:TonB-dependent receptor [Novosphingobium mathurense]SLK08135.1 iron complex outermembrane recepter protein [Novosphingobium mathurense]